jgi:multiple sugar transport system permease protein/putative aldouronate transport system permease protein
MKLALPDKVFQLCATIFLVIAFMVIAYPLWYAVIASFSDPQAVLAGKVTIWPVGISLLAYEAVIRYSLLWVGFANSILYVAGGTTVAVCILLLAAYPLSRRDLPYRKLFQTFFVITMFFGGGLIPNYILLRDLSLIGSRLALIIPFMFSCYNMIIVKTYFQSSISPSLLDAAHIDGCGDIRFFFKIALPLSTPVIAVMVLFNAVGQWNSYFSGMMYLIDPKTYNFQMVLRNILSVATMSVDMSAGMDPIVLEERRRMLQLMKYAVLVVGAAPMMVLYPFIQKFFIRGMMIGSLKE